MPALDHNHYVQGVKLLDRFLCCDRRNARGWVYVIRDVSGRVKIGNASSPSDVRRQLVSAQAWSSAGLVDVRVIHGGEAFERVLHQRFDALRLTLPTPGITSHGLRFLSEWFGGLAVKLWAKRLDASGPCEFCQSELFEVGR